MGGRPGRGRPPCPSGMAAGRACLGLLARLGRHAVRRAAVGHSHRRCNTDAGRRDSVAVIFLVPGPTGRPAGGTGLLHSWTMDGRAMSHPVVGRGEGYRRYTARGSVMFFKAVAEQDGGDFSLMERTLPPGGRRPPPHRHGNCSEAYFVLDGLVGVTLSDAELSVGPEGFVLVP